MGTINEAINSVTGQLKLSGGQFWSLRQQLQDIFDLKFGTLRRRIDRTLLSIDLCMIPPGILREIIVIMKASPPTIH